MARTSTWRNTPTGVGRTCFNTAINLTVWKHPHRRGEDNFLMSENERLMETPPQAWGGQQEKPAASAQSRNTPTGVGRTVQQLDNRHGVKKHPHRRGEDRARQLRFQHLVETPPQAWGGLNIKFSIAILRGNTPTGVGRTVDYFLIAFCFWKHPHRRGEDKTRSALIKKVIETPPQAWGGQFFDERE